VLARVIDQETFEYIDRDLGESRVEDFGQHFDAFINGKQWLFTGIDENGDDDFIEEFARARNDLQMSIGQRIE
jgi:hypothetical protein